ncbi:MAG: hypothetical protein K0S65_3089 [Labilithrix sp.]|nr:hypothetical protein [Labilithrix sp.]
MAAVRSLLVASTFAVVVLASPVVRAQPADPDAPPPAEPTPAPPRLNPVPPEPEPTEPVPAPTRLNPVPPEPATTEEAPPPMSEGRMLVSLYNSGFQWGISPGVIISDGKAGFALGLRFGYGFDTGPVILVPGIRLAGYFIDPNVYLGMPTFKLVLPIDRFAPFIEGGAGVGHVSAGDPPNDAATGAALMGGGGFMIHFSRVAFGAEASYQVVTGTDFKGFGVGPILAIGF